MVIGTKIWSKKKMCNAKNNRSKRKTFRSDNVRIQLSLILELFYERALNDDI